MLVDFHRITPDYEHWRDRLFRGSYPTFDELWGEEGVRAPDWLLTYATTLFAESGTLRDHYTLAELRRGLWALPHRWELSDLLWSPAVDWPKRATCVATMPELYKQLFRFEPLDTTCFMWWDMFRPIAPDHDRRLWAVVFSALAEVLAIPHQDCQAAALHGLGHLTHVDKERLIRSFLIEHPQLHPELVAYAEHSIAGTVL
jgi:hypothetical protein